MRWLIFCVEFYWQPITNSLLFQEKATKATQVFFSGVKNWCTPSGKGQASAAQMKSMKGQQEATIGLFFGTEQKSINNLRVCFCTREHFSAARERSQIGRRAGLILRRRTHTKRSDTHSCVHGHFNRNKTHKSVKRRREIQFCSEIYERHHDRCKKQIMTGAHGIIDT